MGRRGRRADPRPSPATWALLAGLVALAALVVAVGASRGPPADAEADAAALAPASAPSLGNAGAPVTLLAFERPLCPSCRFFHVGRGDASATFDRVVAGYVDTGKVRYVERVAFLLEGWDAQGAAVEKCLWHDRPDLFFTLVHDLYRDQFRISESNFDAYIAQWAANHGWDAGRALACAHEDPYRAETTQDVRDARAAGVSGTPTFLVIAPGGTSVRIVGAQPYETFAEAIEDALPAS